MNILNLPAEVSIACECDNSWCRAYLTVPTQAYLEGTHLSPTGCFQRPECAREYEALGHPIKTKTETYWVVQIDEARPLPTFTKPPVRSPEKAHEPSQPAPGLVAPDRSDPG